MDLWIRSQDKKKLHNIKHLELDNDETGIFNADTYTLLGKYKSKERALEVLDEIQNILQPKVFIKEPKINTDDLIHSMSEYVTIQTTQQIEYDLKQAGQIVYEMPKE